MKKVGWEPDRLFTPTEDVEDAKPKAFAAELAGALGKTEDEIWMAIGQDNIGTFFSDLPGLLPERELILFSSLHV